MHSCLNDFKINFNKLEVIRPNLSNRNKSSISTIISLKQTEKDDIIKGFNNFKKKVENKNINKKKIISTKNIFKNSNDSDTQIKNVKKLSKNKKLKYLNLKHNSSNISNKINKQSNLNLKNLTFNNKNKQKTQINTSNINNISFSKYNDDKMIKTINITNLNNEVNNIKTDSDIQNSSIITFGKNQFYKIPSNFVYIKKNNICYSNSNNIKSKNKSYYNSTTFSTNMEKYYPIQKEINSINISEFRLEEDEKNNSIVDFIDEGQDIDEKKINKINVSYISRYKTIEQIEKKIQSTNIINRIINNNINKKILKSKDIKINKDENDITILNTATFGLMETEKKG